MSVRYLSIGLINIGVFDILAAAFSFSFLLILWVFLEKTKKGIAVRAAAYDTTTAGLMGINVNTISLIVFSISGFASGIAGLFFGLKYAVYPTMGGIAIKAFISSVVGGLGSLPGAVLGGVVLGTLETMVSGYVSSTYRDLFSYSLLVIILFFMPNGLLGKNAKEKS
jgi:branched-chain amino acid transport system permease protein